MSVQSFLGTFGVAVPAEHYGELSVNGADTAIRLLGSNLSSIRDAKFLYAQTARARVSCIGCVWTGTSLALDDITHAEQATVFPHFVTHGARFFNPDVDTVERLAFRFTDIDLLAAGSGSVGSFMAAPSLIEAVLAAAPNRNERPAGDTPVISYFDGHTEVWGLDTAIGRISIQNVIEVPSVRPFKHYLEMSLVFTSPVAFEESVERLLRVRHCMTMLTGRAQAVETIKLIPGAPEAGETRRRPLNLEWCLPPPGPDKADLAPAAFALPLNLLRRPEEFSAVLAGWFARDKAWHWPQVRYVQGIEMGRHYTANRLVAAANMFDLLPDSAYPAPEPLAPEVVKAAAQTRALFKALPDSIERSSVLGALGRFGSLSLPKKINHRGSIVLSQLHQKLPSLQKVLKAAVLCRNHFVHGSAFDLETFEPYLSLMTDTLEFVFVVSDLIELGWRAADWVNGLNGGEHRLAEFLYTYAATIGDFNGAYERAGL